MKFNYTQEEPAPLKPPRRARFQIHLSTAIVLMFTAGVLMWANLRGASTLLYAETAAIRWQTLSRPASVPYGATDITYGWPLYMFRHREAIIQIMDTGPVTWKNDSYEYAMGSIDFAIALLVIFAVWYACEWQIRRCAARKGD